MNFIRSGVLILLLTAHAVATEPVRLWVDANGVHSLEARLVEITDDQSVILIRPDGTSIAVAWNNLSTRDQGYVRKLKERGFSSEPIAPTIRTQTIPVPQPLLDLPPAARQADEGSELRPADAVPFATNRSPARSLPPDPALWVLGATPVRIVTDPIDLYSRCSRPLGVIVTDDDGNSRTMIGVSISDDGSLVTDVAATAWENANRVVRFDVDRRRGDVVLRTPESIRLLDHHLDRGRSLVHLGFDSLGRGGQLAIASGWDQRELTLENHREIDASDAAIPKHLSWAAWIDEEHVLAKVDDTLCLWNLISGQSIYAFRGLDERSVPALSGGRRYVAVPGRGSVDVLTTFDGKSFGRVLTKSNDPPHVAFSAAGDQLAIASKHQMTFYDLQTATVTETIESRRSLGDEPPHWIDANLVLTGSGVLISRSLRLPVWRYDLTASEPSVLGNHVVALRRHPAAELIITKVPHDAAIEAMKWASPAKRGEESGWNLLGRSIWNEEGWSLVR